MLKCSNLCMTKKNSYYSDRREFANLASYLGKERGRSATFNVVVTLDDA